MPDVERCRREQRFLSHASALPLSAADSEKAIMKAIGGLCMVRTPTLTECIVMRVATLYQGREHGKSRGRIAPTASAITTAGGSVPGKRTFAASLSQL